MPHCRHSVTRAGFGPRGIFAASVRNSSGVESAVTPRVTTAMMTMPPANSAKANFQPSIAQNMIRIATFMFVEEIMNANTARRSAPFWKNPRAAAGRAVRTRRSHDAEERAARDAPEVRAEQPVHRRTRERDLNDRRDQEAENQSEEAVPEERERRARTRQELRNYCFQAGTRRSRNAPMPSWASAASAFMLMTSFA